jgi:hypothetical protein
MRFSVKIYDVETATHTWTLLTIADAKLPKLELDVTTQSYATVFFTGDIEPFDVVPGHQLGFCLVVDAVPTAPDWYLMGAGRHERKDSFGPIVDIGIWAVNGNPRVADY